MLSLKKITSIYSTTFSAIISDSGVPLAKFKPINELKKSVELKNKLYYSAICQKVDLFLSSTQSSTSLRFSEHELWQFLDVFNALYLIFFLENHHDKLFRIFKSKSDIIRISKNQSPLKTFNFLFNDSNRAILLNRLGSKGLVKLSSCVGSKALLTFLTDTENWNKLKNCLTVPEIIKFGTHSGSKLTFQYIIQSDRWPILLSRVGRSNLLKILNHNSSSHVLQLLYDNYSWNLLLLRLRTYENVIKASIHDRSRLSFNILIDTDCWDLLVSRLTIPGVIDLSKCSSSGSVFDLFLDNENWASLSSRIDLPTLLKIASKDRSKSVLEILINQDKWEVLCSRFSKDEILNLASYLSAKILFDILLDEKKWNFLSSKFTKSQILSLFSTKRGHKTLDLFFSRDKWSRIERYFSTQSIVEIFGTEGGRQLLLYATQPRCWSRLSSLFDVSLLKKVSFSSSSKFLFDFMLDKDRFDEIEGKIGIDAISHLLTFDSSKYIIESLLDAPSWKTLVDILSKDVLKKILFTDSPAYVFKFVLENPNVIEFDSFINPNVMLSVAQSPNALPLLTLFKDSIKFSRVKSRLTFSNFCKLIPCVSCIPIIDLITNDSKWQSISLILKHDTAVHLLNSFTNSEELFSDLCHHLYISKLLSTIGRAAYQNLSLEDQRGITPDVIKFFTANKLCESDILQFAQLSGRNLPFLINLFLNHKYLTDSFFLPVPIELSIRKPQSIPLKDQLLSFLRVLHLSNTAPLSVTELFQFRTFCFSLKKDISLIDYLYRFVSIAGSFNYPERKNLLFLLSKRGWLDSSFWQSMFSSVPLPLRKWFIERGPEFASAFLNSHIFSQFQIPKPFHKQDFFFFMQSLQLPSLRKYFTKVHFGCFFKSISESPHFFIIPISENRSLLMPPPYFRFSAFDWFRVIVELYNFLSINLPLVPPSNPKSFSSDLFSESDVSLLTTIYPHVLLNDGVITVNINKSILEKFLPHFMNVQSIPPLIHIQPGSSNPESAPRAKRRKIDHSFHQSDSASKPLDSASKPLSSSTVNNSFAGYDYFKDINYLSYLEASVNPSSSFFKLTYQ